MLLQTRGIYEKNNGSFSFTCGSSGNFYDTGMVAKAGARVCNGD